MSSKKNSDPLSVSRLHDTLDHLLGDYRSASFCLAYSGGVDSQVLLHMLSVLRSEYGFDLRAIHVNHGIHPLADSWTRFCQTSCEALGVPLTVERVRVDARGTGQEAAARDARYEVLAQHIVSNNHVLLTAHQQDDQAETLLLHLVRGAGVNGLAAMPMKRRFGAGQLVRPLLDRDRASLLAYAGQHRLDWIEDDSNSDPAVRRSFLRQAIIPKLVAQWPGAVDSIARTARHMAEANTLLQELGQADWRDCVHADSVALDTSRLATLSPSRLSNVLRYWLQCQNAPPPSARQLRGLCEMIWSPPATASAELPLGPGRALIYRDRLEYAATRLPEPPPRRSWDLERDNLVRFGAFELSILEATGTGLARSRVGSSVELRVREGGERCRLPGRQHHTSLKKLLQQNGVAPWERNRLPLLYVADELAAIGDRWICEPFRARDGEPSWKLQMSKIA